MTRPASPETSPGSLLALPGSLPPPLRSKMLEKIGLEDFDEFDPATELESPRSVLACLSEGVRPKDLTYVPPESFQHLDVSIEVAKFRYTYFEALRQDLLAIVKKARSSILAGEKPQSSMFRSSATSEYGFAYQFFQENLKALGIHNLTTKEDWSACKRTLEFKRVDMYAAARSSPSLSPKSSFMTSPVFKERCCEPDSLKWYQYSSDTWRYPTSRSGLDDAMKQIKAAPGADWREVESARRVEDTFGVLREFKLRRREERHQEENVQNEKRKKSMVASFKSLEFEQQRKDRLREIREYMMPPQLSSGASYSAYHERAKVNRARDLESQESYRRERNGVRATKVQALEIGVEEERNERAMGFAQMNMEDRLHWRHNYAAVLAEKATERRHVLEDFRRKQAQIDFANRQKEDSGDLKREIMGLRSTHRLLDEYRQKRKAEFEEKLRAHHIQDLAKKRELATRMGRVTLPPPASNLASPLEAQESLLEVDEEDTAERQWQQRALKASGSPKGLPRGVSAPSLLIAQ